MSSLIIIDVYFLFQQQGSARGVSRNEEESRKLSQSLRLFFKNQYTFHAFAYPAYFDLPFILVLILSVSFSNS